MGRAFGAILRNSHVILFNDLESYILRETGNVTSIAIIEMVNNVHMRWLGMEVYRVMDRLLVVEMHEAPRLSFDCIRSPAYPRSWDVRCVDPRLEPNSVRRHDASLPGRGEDSLMQHDVVVDFGQRSDPDIKWESVQVWRFLSASQATGRIDRLIMSGPNITVAGSRIYLVAVIRGGPQPSICIHARGRLEGGNGMVCRSRRWPSEMVMLSAFQALQITANNYEFLWETSSFWASTDNERAETVVKWVSTSLEHVRGVSLSDVQTVATVNHYFLAGFVIILLSMAAGAVSILGLSLGSRGAHGDYWYLTLEGSRRVLAMSALSRLNCNRTPNKSPLTALVRTGDLTCHVSTYYGRDVEVLGDGIIKAGKLLVLGGRRKSSRLTPPGGRHHIGSGREAVSRAAALTTECGARADNLESGDKERRDTRTVEGGKE
ncbi:unnamed protein product [Chondrus crispus]|uniref:Uncharacterized protein n=1 Tax=Chondrus crispus TaxID=2769 RepID=R7QHS6_CHOCR|nr:unnamed protein product [Chondrus crispus]CDF37328.1 unnamed protein product [Chondrus crispus]|eukprot:XP_005717147.1 unnamed protein product [Chondrus crispus]